MASRRPKGEAPSSQHEHVVQFYENDRFLSECVYSFSSGAWQQGHPVLLIATQAHRKAFERTLKARGCNLQMLAAAGLLTWRDVRSVLALIMVDGMPDAALAGQHLSALIEAGKRGVPGGFLYAYSELVDFVWQSGNTAAATRLEELWNGVIARSRCSLLCAYDLRHFDRASDAAGLVDVCRHHSRAVPSESYREDSTPEERQRLVLALQQRARALETEKRQHLVLEQWLRRALAARRTTERARSDPARVSLTHELKTPLNTILGWTQMLTAGQTDERTLHHAIEVIGRNAKELNVLIDGLIEPQPDPIAPGR